MGDMSAYLSEVPADYTAEELDLPPHDEVVEFGEKEQFVHKFSDGQKGVVTMADQSYFTVTLSRIRLSSTAADFIMDLFHNPAKANGIARSFYWVHPSWVTYTVKFAEPLGRGFTAGVQGVSATRQITLDVIGVKPA